MGDSGGGVEGGGIIALSLQRKRGIQSKLVAQAQKTPLWELPTAGL